jgi:hypothetical protein
MSDSSQQFQLESQTGARAAAARLGSEFDAFLFSAIGDDRNGMSLSVVSLLARRDLDPWQEAARLAEMPTAAATRRLESFIRALPDQPLTLPDSGAVAARLVALLPRVAHLEIQGSEKHAKALDAKELAPSRRTLVIGAILLVSMILLMRAQLAQLRAEVPTRPVAADARPVPVMPHHTPPPPPTEK